MAMKATHGVIGLAQELIAIPSVNPAGNPGTGQTGEGELAAYLADLLTQWGGDVRQEEVQPGRPNLHARWPASARKGRRKRPLRVALAPHLDTVSVKGMTIPPFEPVVKRGRLYGRGASDTKGPMAAMLWAVRQWQRRPEADRQGLELSFAGLMGEEHGNEGAIAWAQAGVGADLVLVGEPTEMRVVHAHKGSLWFELRTEGRACHSSMPEEGDNAIYHMAEVLRRIEKKLIPAVRRHRHPLLGRATLSVGLIRGGQKVNIVPDSALIECDVRTVPGLTSPKLKAMVAACFKGMAGGPRYGLMRHNPSLDVSRENSLVACVGAAAEGFAVAPWFCDAGIVASGRRPAVAIGPGSIAQAHTPDEFIKIKELEAGAAGFLKIFEALAARGRA